MPNVLIIFTQNTKTLMSVYLIYIHNEVPTIKGPDVTYKPIIEFTYLTFYQTATDISCFVSMFIHVTKHYFFPASQNI